MKTVLKRVLAGFAIGLGAVAPGVSGGAVAVVCGLYPRITDAVTHFFADVRRHLALLLPLACGGVFGVLTLGRVLGICFALYPTVTQTVFLGLMAGTLPSVVRTSCREGVRPWYVLLCSFTFCLGLFLFRGTQGGGTPLALSFADTMMCGALLAFGTVVPGVSSTFLLLALGRYESTLAVLSGQDIGGLLPLGLGFIGAALLLVRLVDIAYRKAYGATSFAVLGWVLSSMVPAVPPLGIDRESCLLLLLLIGCAALSRWGMQVLKRFS